ENDCRADPCPDRLAGVAALFTPDPPPGAADSPNGALPRTRAPVALQGPRCPGPFRLHPNAAAALGTPGRKRAVRGLPAMRRSLRDQNRRKGPHSAPKGSERESNLQLQIAQRLRSGSGAEPRILRLQPRRIERAVREVLRVDDR